MISDKIFSEDELLKQLAIWKNEEKSIVLTNGCFDLLHFGHVSYLEKAAQLGDILVVAVNSDDSVHRLKGEGRPINDLHSRMGVLAALESVSAVVSFQEDWPEGIISRILPDVLVKGADYAGKEVAGREAVESAGGKLILIPMVDGLSTTAIANRLKSPNKL